MGVLYVVATPIGNLGDITLRALRLLREVDVVLCEDTRVTKKLLAHYEISARTLSFHAHSGAGRYEQIISLLGEDKTLALVTDAGTPGISDPGVELVAYIREHAPDVRIESVPGPSALAAALSVAGVPAHTFSFLGFPPHKKGRMTFFDTIAYTPHAVVFYESTHRIEKALEALNEREPDRTIVLVKELTKMFETVERGTPAEVLLWLAGDPARTKGEFVVIVEPQK